MDSATLHSLESERRQRRNEAAQAASSNTAAAGSAVAWKDGDRNVLVAYALAFIYGGFFGLHHLYLGRSSQAFLWACSGGFCGIGILYDALKMPYYAGVRNMRPEVQEQLEVEMKYNKVPRWRFSRLVAAYFLGSWFGQVGSCFGPELMPEAYFDATQALGGALGIWLVGIACTHQGGSLIWTCAASLIGKFALGGCPVLSGIAAFQWTRRWEPEAKKRQAKWWQVLLAVFIFWSVALGGFLEHASITMEDGATGKPKTYKVKSCLWNIVNGIDWEDIRDSFSSDEETHSEWYQKWQSSWENLKGRLDVQGERRALKTLGMADFIGKDYTEDDVKQHYKKMARLWHPDRAAPDKKHEAEQRMQEINLAKEVLDKITGSDKKHRR